MPKASRNTRLCEGNACGASAAYAGLRLNSVSAASSEMKKAPDS